MTQKYTIVDNRGTKPDLMPEEAFSILHQIRGITTWKTNYYTREEAERAVEMFERNDARDAKVWAKGEI
jgi:hypothetical protein